MPGRLPPMPTRAPLVTAMLAGLLAALAWTGPAAQIAAPGARRFATTVDALVAYPVFFHAQTVRVRGAIGGADVGVTLTQGDASVLLVGQAAEGLSPDPAAVHAVTGLFLDVGRLTANDPRLQGIDASALSQRQLGKPWPGVKELLLLVAASIEPALPFPAPSVRTLSLDPGRYAGSRVTISGRYRGRNLYGDQPDAPGQSRWDFVLQSADASIWVVGLRPRGHGFSLSVDSRVDTDRWLEVTGVVRHERHLVVVEGDRVSLAQPPPRAQQSEAVARVPTVGPRPEVVFSMPTSDETDVSLTARVRVQFSRDLDPSSIQGQVRVGYLTAQSAERGEPPPPAVTFTTRYDEGTRTLEVRFAEPLDAFRTMRVQLLEGIRATDGAALVPWSLMFTLGG